MEGSVLQCVCTAYYTRVQHGGKCLQAPASLLEALEQHLASLEGKKGVTTTTTTAAK